jgi:hypothetical protein
MEIPVKDKSVEETGLFECETDEDDKCYDEHEKETYDKFMLIQESKNIKSQTINHKHKINEYLTLKFKKLWNDEQIAGLNTSLLNVECYHNKRTDDIYNILIRFTIDGRIKISYELHRCKTMPEFKELYTIDPDDKLKKRFGYYDALYTEHSRYESKYLFMKSEYSVAMKEDGLIKLKKIVDVLFSDYCEFVL